MRSITKKKRVNLKQVQTKYTIFLGANILQCHFNARIGAILPVVAVHPAGETSNNPFVLPHGTRHVIHSN